MVVDIAAVGSLVSSVNTSLGVLKTAVEVRDQIKFGAAVSEIQTKLIAAQEGILASQATQSSLVNEISALKQQIAKLEAWDAEKKRYQLQELPPGTFVYALKRDAANGEPAHSICQACYQKGKKSILQASEPINGVHTLTCSDCNAVLQVGTRLQTGPLYARVRGPIA